MSNQERTIPYKDPTWFLRDARSSAIVRMVNGRWQRYHPSPELEKLEAKIGNKENHGKLI